MSSVAHSDLTELTLDDSKLMHHLCAQADIWVFGLFRSIAPRARTSGLCAFKVALSTANASQCAARALAPPVSAKTTGHQRAAEHGLVSHHCLFAAVPMTVWTNSGLTLTLISFG